MPTYEYECEKCGHEFEKFQSMKDAPIKKCPKCGKLSVVRLISRGAAILFKGSGFYQTDYRSKGYQESAKKDSPEKKAAPDAASAKPSPAKDSGKKDSGKKSSQD